MKKNHLLSGFLMLAVVATLFVACQKEQNGVSTENGNNSANVNESVSGVATNGGNIAGMISGGDAEDMHEAYVKANPGKTQYVKFQVKDLQAFLSVLKSKYKSDAVYVNFGVYNSQNATSRANVGKVTVFFSGDDNRKKSGTVKTNDINAADDTATDYLNHGGIWP